ncbi:unnamed protein product [Citrullus colocynthis]|uniref:J domain-containing protein n=1 Tax=Citrullus colocynthis TaxID=252529 RepID=A0ABP0YMI4_9ROSI
MFGKLSAAAEPLAPVIPPRRKVSASAGALAYSNSRKSICPYEILRIEPNASAVEIKSAYRRLAKRYHPDTDSSESEGWRFMEIHEAYTTLSDPSARLVYDSWMWRRRAVDLSIGRRTGFFLSRRWETDQCW